jgi:hypothetical protein
MVNYNKGIIYKLCCKNPEITDIYIGSTTDFTKRKFNHKSACKKSEKNVYNFIRENGNWDNWDMVQIEVYKADSKRDLESRERYWIELLKSTLNKNIPTRTPSEYYQNNKEVIAKNTAEYYQNNKEVIAEKQAEYRQKNKEVMAEKDAEYYQKNKEIILEKKAEFYQNNKEVILEKRSEYYQNNKEVIAEYKAKYHQKNKEVILEKKAEYYQKNKEILSEKVVCDCGSEVTKRSLIRHTKSKKHLKYLETI